MNSYQTKISSTKPSTGFTLIELLMVMGVISVLMVASVSALRSSSSQLLTGGARFADTLNLARSEAITRQTVVRLRIARDWTGRPESNFRSFSLWALDPEADPVSPAAWQQISQWERLPEGVVLDASAAASNGTSFFAEFPVETSSLNVGANSVMVLAMDFTPRGSLIVPSSASGARFTFRLAQGFLDDSGSVVYTGSTQNWFEVGVDRLTGMATSYRPL